MSPCDSLSKMFDFADILDADLLDCYEMRLIFGWKVCSLLTHFE